VRAAPSVVLITLAVLLPLAVGCGRRGGGEEERGPEGTAPAATASAPAPVTLLFPGLDGRLGREGRTLPLPASGEARVAALVDALLAGPESAQLARPFVEGVAVGEVFVDPHGIAYVDLVAPEQPDPPASGSRFEMLRVYSVVDTVLLNTPEVRAVVLLWNGRQRATFAGHVDTGRPLGLDESLVAAAD
jgi:hypothetical protein